ncbi:MAG TPA: NAD(+) diphosphatase [Burkholderiaceae bacterium]|nr:NAD(+) diphosphatase [Burkholderiaceae bacterium]
MPREMFPFVASSRFQHRPGSGLWFAFRKRQLLVVESWSVPRGPSLDLYGVAPLRVQFLGHLGGEPCYSAELPADVEPPEGSQFRDLRQLFGRLDDATMAVAGRAVQIMEWDRTHQFCGACASPTVPHERTRARVCTNPGCGLEHYPRLAPAMIVAVERGPEILLARSPHFPPGIYSVLAGFVDPGESAEDAVRREVFEETAIHVDNIRYYGSQAWPFPNSLMLGFQADYAGGEIVPEAEEIEDAKFFHVEDLPKRFPGRVSIAQWLLDDFCERHGRPVVR